MHVGHPRARATSSGGRTSTDLAKDRRKFYNPLQSPLPMFANERTNVPDAEPTND